MTTEPDSDEVDFSVERIEVGFDEVGFGADVLELDVDEVDFVVDEIEAGSDEVKFDNDKPELGADERERYIDEVEADVDEVGCDLGEHIKRGEVTANEELCLFELGHKQ